MIKIRISLLPMAILVAATAGCNFALSSGGTLSPADVQTRSAQTLTAMSGGGPTKKATLAGNKKPGGGGKSGQATDTPTEIAASPTDTPTITSTSIPCNWAQFNSDVTIPDDWQTTPSDTFTKTWQLQNIGSCAWTSSYWLVFDHGDQMSAPAEQQLTSGEIEPGGTIAISVNLKSPTAPGTYQGYFKLRASDGTVFGIGSGAADPFWVKIKVALPSLVHPPLIQHIGTPIIPLVATTQEFNSSITLAAGEVNSATVSCPSGTVVTGGGFAADINVWVFTQLDNAGNGWIVYAKNNRSTSTPLTAYVICLTYPSAVTTQMMTSVSIDAGHSASQTVTCPSGSVVTGGGYTGKGDGTLWTYASWMNGNGWQVSAKNTGAYGTAFNVYAVCLSGTPLSTTAVTGNADIAPGSVGFAEAACPAGKTVSGGGFGLSDDLIPWYSVLTSSGWRVFAHNGGAHTRGLLSEAVCVG
jgi:hypothetical protein